ncbi:APC family permease [Chryseolinea lacunae]|uniref:Amino acid permease n=1 Tax=Chryseolinea lacunae TaxID=2801331 RepID=A0ABS1KUA2_9BACT|nr:amino acid permease [Chryseolinea lacunae]MBL0742817.1 amino acid permease [Chryseolinea lacunae]
MTKITGNEPARHELKKVLGVGFGVAVMIGGTIGAGILRTPGTIALLLDNYWLIVLCWLFGGAYVLLGVSSFSEMSTIMPKAGGPYNYAMRAFGTYAGFLIGWLDFLINAIAPAYFCIVISEYLSLLFPVMAGYESLVAVSFLFVFTLFHLGGVQRGSIAQQIMSLAKVLFFVVLIGACFLVKVEHSALSQPLPPLKGGVIIAILKSMQLIVGAYDGWWSGCFFAEEDKDPGKNIPRSLFTGAITVILIYVIFNIALFYVLPIGSISTSTLPASDAAKVVFGSSGATFVVVLAVASLVSTLNAYMMIPPRILFGLSRDKFFVNQGTFVNKGGTPVVTLLCSSALAFVLILLGSFEALFSLSAFISLIVLGFSFAALVKLRISEPNLHRPYRARGYPYTSIVVLLVTLALFVGFAISDPFNLILIVIITGLTYPAYWLFVKRRVNS